jgi:hypothetical protein
MSTMDGKGEEPGWLNILRLIKQKEVDWSAQYFAERKNPKWILLSNALAKKESHHNEECDEMASFSTMRSKVLGAWQTWISSPTNSVVPPAALSITPVPLGSMIAQSVVNPNQNITSSSPSSVIYDRWSKQFSKRPTDIQLLAWLHLLNYNDLSSSSMSNNDNNATRKELWNRVVIVQHSPLPFLIRAKLTLQAYSDDNMVIQSISFNPTVQNAPLISANLHEDEKILDDEVMEWLNVLRSKGLENDWWRALWETYHFKSTKPSILNLLKSKILVNRTAPEQPEIYQLLRMLDKSSVSAPFTDATSIVTHMIYSTFIVLLTLSDTTLSKTTIGQILSTVAYPITAKLDLSLSTKIIKISHLLHLHSLMSFAQMRRAATLFWTLVHYHINSTN